MTITREDALKVLEVVDGGLGIAMRETPCVEWAVCRALEGRASDKPACVAQAVRLLGIRMNDSNWSGEQARAKGLRRFAIAQLGTAGFDEREFDRRATEIGHSYAAIGASYAGLCPGNKDSEYAAQMADGYANHHPDKAQGAQYAVRAAAAAADYYGGELFRDRVLAQYAEQIVGVLIDMRAPGCQWLGLIPAD